MSRQWHYSQDGASFGPVGESEIIRLMHSGELPPDVLVCFDGGSEWLPARQYTCFQVEINPEKKAPEQAASVTVPKSVSAGTSQGQASIQPKTSGLAIASLVCGILAVCTGVTGLLGLIFGIIAIRKINGSAGTVKGTGLAMGGLITSVVGLIVVIGVFAGVLLPALAKAKRKSQTLQSTSNQRNISQAYVMYLDDNEGWYPVVRGSAGVGGKMGNGLVEGSEPLSSSVSRQYGALVPIGERPLNKYIGMDEGSLKVFHDPSDAGGGAYSVLSYWESFGTSYRPQTADDTFRVKRVLGDKNKKEGSYEATSMHEAEMQNPVNKIIQGDWNWPYDGADAWHGRNGDARHIMLFGDGHVERFVFPPTSTMTNWFKKPAPDPNFTWW